MPVLVDLASGSKRYPLFKNITRLGTDEECDVRVTGEDVSKDHAQILREGDDFVLISLGRGRPLLVNGKKEKRARLREGDIIEIGDTRLLFNQQTTAEEPVNPHGDAYRQIVVFS